MKQYHEMLRHILDNGEDRLDRTGTGTKSVFGYQNRYDLRDGFPLVTTKQTNFRIIAEELLWFIKGSTDIKDLHKVNVKIWDADAYRNYRERYPKSDLTKEEFLQGIKDETLSEQVSDLGPIYGAQWRSWEVATGAYQEPEFIDQLANLIQGIKDDPFGRRHIISAWNVADLPDMALPPCHLLFQFYVSTDGRLSCQLYQRSADSFLGVPFNIASYALLTHLIAHVTDLEVGEFIHTFGDAHIYNNHIEQVELQLSREPKTLPSLILNSDIKDIDSFTMKDILLLGYDSHERISGKVSVGK